MVQASVIRDNLGHIHVSRLHRRFRQQQPPADGGEGQLRPPYGQDLPGGVATGRFFNGLVPGDLLASMLGVKELLPPYLSDNLQPNDLLTGVAFASRGSGYDPLTSTLLAARSSAEQLELFRDYKEKLGSFVRETYGRRETMNKRDSIQE
ncbi:unnamed protein product [Urochloa humidicola]